MAGTERSDNDKIPKRSPLWRRPGDAVLAAALSKGWPRAARWALRLGADPDRRLNPEGDTPAIRAARSDQAEILRALIPVADLSLRDFDRGHTAWLAAAGLCRLGALRELAPVSDMAQRDGYGRDALILAAEFGDPACVEALLGWGCDPLAEARFDDPGSARGKSALAAACHSSRSDCARLLLPVSDPLSAPSWSGRTPLMTAAGWGSFEIVELLLPVSDPLARDEQGRHALDHAMSPCSWTPKSDAPKTAKLLAQATESALAQSLKDEISSSLGPAGADAPAPTRRRL